MDSTLHFDGIKDFANVLSKEHILFHELFERRKSEGYRLEFAMAAVDYKMDRIQYLIDHGVVHQNGDLLELDSTYSSFFEEILDKNEEINISSIRDFIESIKEIINYFRNETNEHQRNVYQIKVRKILYKIGLFTTRNVINLHHQVEYAYKQEPNYKNKIKRLQDLDEKRRSIRVLISESESLFLKEAMFFSISGNYDMQEARKDLQNVFTDAEHDLLKIEHRIIKYLNRIEQLTPLYLKLRRLKYLKDQSTWRHDTDVQKVLDSQNPICMQKRQYRRLHLCLEMLRDNDYFYNQIRKNKDKVKDKVKSRTEAEPIDPEYLAEDEFIVEEVNCEQLMNAFSAQSADLLTFIINYDYESERSLDEHLNLYGRIVTSYYNLLDFSDKYKTIDNDIEYNLIYAKQYKTNL